MDQQRDPKCTKCSGILSQIEGQFGTGHCRACMTLTELWDYCLTSSESLPVVEQQIA